MNDPLLTPQRYTRIRELFLQVCELDPLERSAILDSACADDGDLRGEVESLLREDSHASGIVGEHEQRQHAVSSLARSASIAALESLPCQFGRYHLLRVIGEGGMGTVYEAQQLHPHRMVALKLLRPGLTTAAMLRRFDYEAHVLGLLHHPGIAQIFEAGTADRGQGEQPFFAMELIHGQPLLKYAAQHTLPVRQKLELMAHVCDAVQHAHTKGVVHRDLKPNNILIDESGQPKILDFGVARATDCDIQTTTLHTQVGQLVGTLAYMSPEQAGGNPDEVDTRSDVYSLGVICYELLSGRLPLDLDRKPLHEAVRMIREQDPPRLGAMNRAFRGDVEIIVAAAMEKETSRRYSSAATFRDDIERYLSHQPIAALSPRFSYNFRRFAQRHTGLIAASVIVTLLTLAAVVGTSYGLVRAIQERDKARVAAERADAQMRAADQARAESDRTAQRADATLEFLRDMLASADPKNSGKRDVRVQEILETAVGRIDTLTADPAVRAAVQYTLGNTYSALGDFDAAEKHLTAALRWQEAAWGAADRETLTTTAAMCVLRGYQGRYQESLELAEQAYQHALTAYGPDDRSTLAAQHYRGRALWKLTRLPEALAVAEDTVARKRALLGPTHFSTLATIETLANIQSDLAQYDKALELLETNLTHQVATLGPIHPIALGTKANLASVLVQLNQLDRAEQLYREVLDQRREIVGPNHFSTLQAASSLARLFSRRFKHDEAASLLRETLAIQTATLGPEHPDTLGSLSGLASMLQGVEKYAEAAEIYRQLLEARQRVLGPTHADTVTTMQNLGTALHKAGLLVEAESHLHEAVALRRELRGNTHPQTLTSIFNLGMVLKDLGRIEDALPLTLEAVTGMEKSLGKTHRSTRMCMYDLVDQLLIANQPEEALVWGDRLVAIGEETLPVDDIRLTSYRALYGRCLLQLGRYHDAEPLLLRSYEEFQEKPEIPRHYIESVLKSLTTLYTNLDNAELAQTYAEALAARAHEPAVALPE